MAIYYVKCYLWLQWFDLVAQNELSSLFTISLFTVQLKICGWLTKFKQYYQVLCQCYNSSYKFLWMTVLPVTSWLSAFFVSIPFLNINRSNFPLICHLFSMGAVQWTGQLMLHYSCQVRQGWAFLFFLLFSYYHCVEIVDIWLAVNSSCVF